VVSPGWASSEAVEIIRQESGMANAVRADVTSHEDIRSMVKACTDLYGRIDVVDYNVGLAHVGGVVELPEEVDRSKRIAPDPQSLPSRSRNR
jgi:NAD(P)-dependent dehydrogenase (short-subunit alcohol dehydrogenase family)